MFLLSRIGLLVYFKNEWMNMMVKQATRKNNGCIFFPRRHVLGLTFVGSEEKSDTVFWVHQTEPTYSG